MKYLFFLIIIALTSCKQQYFIVVRHAEKAAVPPGASKAEASDPPLSEQGQARAARLATILRHKPIGYIYSTTYKRTTQTVTPISELLSIPITTYPAASDSMDAFIARVKKLKAKAILIAGHSNTIDDIANKLAEKKVVDGDLPETEYDNIFVIRRKGNNLKFIRKKY